MVDLSSDLKKQVENYSGGMKRRLSLAIALLGKPKLLVLDEPTVGIDPALRRKIWRELYKQRDNGVGILITTHVMDEAELCNKVGLLLVFLEYQRQLFFHLKEDLPYYKVLLHP